jgi:Raf kinase inhibitor-like YbhB/YbcL family protein
MTLSLVSAAFDHMSDIPKIHTCQGDNSSPPLSWSGVPPQTKSLVLVIDDPDAPDPAAPKQVWVHWLVYNLPPKTSELQAGIKTLPPETKQGVNDWKKIGYGGPCPPIGRHRYFHKLFALDRVLPDLHNPTFPQLSNAMRGHIIAKAELIGLYQKTP